MGFLSLQSMTAPILTVLVLAVATSALPMGVADLDAVSGLRTAVGRHWSRSLLQDTVADQCVAADSACTWESPACEGCSQTCQVSQSPYTAAFSAAWTERMTLDGDNVLGCSLVRDLTSTSRRLVQDTPADVIITQPCASPATIADLVAAGEVSEEWAGYFATNCSDVTLTADEADYLRAFYFWYEGGVNSAAIVEGAPFCQPSGYAPSSMYALAINFCFSNDAEATDLNRPECVDTCGPLSDQARIYVQDLFQLLGVPEAEALAYEAEFHDAEVQCFAEITEEACLAKDFEGSAALAEKATINEAAVVAAPTPPPATPAGAPTGTTALPPSTARSPTAGRTTPAPTTSETGTPSTPSIPTNSTVGDPTTPVDVKDSAANSAGFTLIGVTLVASALSLFV